MSSDEIRGYHNVCRHRGNRLVEDCTNARNINCSFHGWTWNLDGSLKHIPCRWDFPDVRDDAYGLTECKIERWNGWVFINLDPDAEPLQAFLGCIQGQLDTWPQQRMWKACHVGKVIPCNWKVAIEAFLETYHPPRVHPSALPYTSDYNAQYDFYGPHARMLVPLGVPSPTVAEKVDPQQVVDAMLGDAGLGGMLKGGALGSGYGSASPILEPGQSSA